MYERLHQVAQRQPGLQSRSKISSTLTPILSHFFQFASDSDSRALFPFDSDFRLFEMVKFRFRRRFPLILLT